MPKRSGSSVDLEVGARIRLRRISIGMSQERLAALLGVTFQQVQKYEKGANRVSVGRLLEISDALEAPVTYFFEGLSSRRPAEDDTVSVSRPQVLLDFDLSGESLKLNRAFAALKSAKLRRKLVDLVADLANGNSE